MMKKWMLKVLGVLSLVFGLTGCNSVKVESWADPEFEERPMGNTMILGIADQNSTSLVFEGYFVSQLYARGVQASSCHEMLNPTDILTEEELVKFLEDHQFDSIIVTRLLDAKDRVQYVQMGGYPDHYADFYGYYSYGMAHATGYVENFMEYILETNLYDVKTRKLVWSGQKSIYDLHNKKDNMRSVVYAVIKDLKKRDLL